MEESIPLIATALITAVMTGIGTKLIDSWNEYRRGRKDEAQRIATRLGAEQRANRELRELLTATRVMAVEAGVKLEELPSLSDVRGGVKEDCDE